MRDELQDDRVVLRRHRREHAEQLYEAGRASVAEVGRWMPWCRDDLTVAQCEQWLEEQIRAWDAGTAYEFAIFDRAAGHLVGGAGLNRINSDAYLANLGYWVRSGEQGRGLATRAGRLVAAFGIEELGLRRIEIVAAVDNHASCRVAEKIGALREAILRKRVVIGDGSSVAAVMFSVIPDDHAASLAV